MPCNGQMTFNGGMIGSSLSVPAGDGPGEAIGTICPRSSECVFDFMLRSFSLRRGMLIAKASNDPADQFQDPGFRVLSFCRGVTDRIVIMRASPVAGGRLAHLSGAFSDFPSRASKEPRVSLNPARIAARSSRETASIS